MRGRGVTGVLFPHQSGCMGRGKGWDIHLDSLRCRSTIGAGVGFTMGLLLQNEQSLTGGVLHDTP